jgi:hypothetical protein
MLLKELIQYRDILRDPVVFDALIDHIGVENREIMLRIYQSAVRMWEKAFNAHAPAGAMTMGEIYKTFSRIHGSGLEVFQDRILEVAEEHPDHADFLYFMLGAFRAGWHECVAYKYWKAQ